LSYDFWQEPLPRTTTRKIKRFEVERRVRAAQGAAKAEALPARELSGEEREWLSLPDVARAVRVIEAAAKNEGREIRPGDNIELDLGLDSMERVELLAALRLALDAPARDWAATQVFTVRELVDAVRAGAGEGGGGRALPTWETILKSGEPDPEAAGILRPRPLTDALWRALFAAVHGLARGLYGLRVEGLDKLPKDRPFILSPNHQSFLDGPVLVSALPFSLRRKLFYVGTSEIFGSGLALRVARSLRLIPIDPDANLIQAMKAGAFGLSQGRGLILFPEGERSIDGEPKAFKKGAAILSAHLQVPIVPAALEGFHEAWPRGEGLKFSGRLRIVFGDPIPPPAAPSPDRAEALYARMTAELREKVVAMRDQLVASRRN
jgi:long-chain acyl-CoA synthetase